MSICLYCGEEIPKGSYNYKTASRMYCSKTCTKMAWKRNNADKVVAEKAAYRKRHKARLQASNTLWKRSNRKQISNYQLTRYRRIQLATPIWANRTDILDVYLEAAYFQLEVDHIIPINHPLVCGLHVWDNLQLLSRSENAKKYNSFSIE